MKNKLKISARLLSNNKSFNDDLVKIVDEKNIPMNIDFGVEFLRRIDVIIVDKDFYLEHGLDKLYDKTKYIIYLIDEEDYNTVFIKKLYENNVFDIFNSCSIKQEIERKLWALVKLISEEDTDQLLDIILDSIEDSIAITDEDGNLEYVNKGFLKTTGYELNEVIGENPRFLKSDAHTAAFYNDLWNTITRDGIWRGDFINIKKSGDLVYEEAIIYPIELSNRKYLKIARNITKKRFLKNKIKLSISLAKNVLETSSPVNYKDDHIEFNYFVKYMNALGGDFIWFNQISKGKYILVLVDVTGHDLSSALVLMKIIKYIKEYKADEVLGTLAIKINEYLNGFNKRADTIKLVSGIFCVIDIENSELQYINAGHPSGLLFEEESLNLNELKGNTMLLGVKTNLVLEADILPLSRASDLIMYSDGLLEYYLKDYTEINPKAYRNMFYEGKQLKFLKIKEDLMNKEHMEDDLSLAHIRFKIIGETNVN